VKHWTTRQASASNTVSPDLLNKEFTADRSSITTLSREQVPANFIDETRLEDYALHQVWEDRLYPNSSGGQQNADADPDAFVDTWRASTQQVHAGGWTNINTQPITLSGFKGGSLYFEYGANVFAYTYFQYTGDPNDRPGAPNYVALRILVNGITLVERRGVSGIGRSRIFGSANFPPGDLTVFLQFKLTDPSTDSAKNSGDPAPNNIMYGHLFSGRYLAIGRYR